MNKTFKKVLACVLSIAMIATSITVSNTTVNAALAGTDMEANIKNAEYNLALNKDTDVYPNVAEGKKAYLNDGIVDNTNANHVALTTSNNWGYTGESYAVIDLGDYYDASSLDKILVQYKDAAGNDTVLGKTFNIQYSVDGMTYTTIYTSDTVTAFDENNSVTTDVSSATGNVRYVKIDYPTTAHYGIQINEIAIFSANPVKGEVDQCDNAAAVAVSSDNEGEITVNITAGEGQDGYKYIIYLDDSTTPSFTGCEAGIDYKITGVASGSHTVKVVSAYNGALSTGLVSNPVVVKTVMDYLKDNTKNLAYGKTYYILDKNGEETEGNANSAEGTGNITDGEANSQYVTPQKKTAGSYFIIDLGQELDPTGIDAVHVFYRLKLGGCYPENGGQQIQFAGEDKEWTTVGSLTQQEFNAQIGDAPFDVITKDFNVSDVSAVRYVKVYYPNAVAYGAQVTEIAVMGTAREAEVAYKVTVNGGEPTSVAKGTLYKLPTDAAYGYYYDGKMYRPGAEVTVESDMAFTSVTKLDVTVSPGAGIRIDGTPGIRFKAKVTTDNETALNSDAIKEGMLITASDLLGEAPLTINADDITKINIENSGWYNNEVGSYCGSVINIAPGNYTRAFKARAYVIINYADGTQSAPVYSGYTGDRSIQYVAELVKKSSKYSNLSESQQKLIDMYAAAGQPAE